MDIAVLGLDIRSTSAVKAANDLDKVTASAGKAETQVKKTAAATAQVGKAASGSTAGMRNLGMQLNQVGQQGAVTGNYLQALSIQLPDMLLGFGGVGIAAGIAASALVGVGAAMFDTTDKAKAFDDAMKDLEGSTLAFERATKGLNLGDLSERFRAVTPEIIAMEEAFARFNLVQLMLDAAAATDALSSRFDGLWRSGEANLAALFDTTTSWSAETGNLERGFDLVRDALNAVGSATSIEDQLSTTRSLRQALEEVGFSSEDATEEQRRFYFETLAAERALQTAASAAGVFATNMGGAADEAGRAAANAASAVAAFNAMSRAQALGTGGGRGDGMDEWRRRADPAYQGSASDYLRSADAEMQRQINAILNPREVKAKSGGRSAELKEHNERMRDAQRIFEATRTEAEKYAAEIADLNELHRLGYLNAVTLGRAVDALSDDFNKVTENAERGADAISDIFTSVLDGSRSAREAVADLLMEIAKAEARKGFMMLAGAGGSVGSFFSGLGGLLGGARADGGPVTSGKTYLVGENGPELFTPSNTGSIVPNHALGQGGGGNITIAIDARGSVEGEAERFGRVLRAAMPGLRDQLLGEVRNKRARGYGL